MRHYLAALKQHDKPCGQARTQLLSGAWLRRSRRKAEARTRLLTAVDYPDRTGAPSRGPNRPGLAHAQPMLAGETAGLLPGSLPG
jgi:hypothetical protein